MTASLRVLPQPVRRLVPEDMVGYLALGVVCFAVDVALLVLLDRHTPVPLPIAVVVADVLAWSLLYQLNRTLNFGSRAPVGPEAVRWGALAAVCLVLSAGFTTAVEYLGVPTAVSRIVAGVVLAVVGYGASRWWVFRDRHRRSRST
ncbi:MAG: GtrA family protein [Pseudonocardiaceae bacterium]